ncbi:alpha/beta fold hydrolase [Nocardioides daeguensis]|uniref:AB hydrolase-1 domain-containing protein n=1 Tax=Nocardioides daeguensis TaxID=908359 RepID=A0ABP6UV70_9ACTN|nr:alpha/beta fold hydrolase [Nocardioides daeguensis]MBV6725915.1 alpha/beta hydrolase [Nocardioides daeguensis]MCR1772570.1 alpha/beta hydrolase [Nocardioides daeguensis]
MTTRVMKTASRHALKGSLVAAGYGGKAAVHGLRTGIRRTQRFPALPELPAGRLVDLPGRGEAFVVDTGAPEGNPGAPTLLLFHGLATTSYLTWFSTLAELCETHRVVMLDQRWHGHGIVSERFSLEDCVDDAAAVLDVLGIERVVAVGYSMGGALAQLFWRRHGERTAGLVLASTAACWRESRGDALFYPTLDRANDWLRDHYRRQVLEVRAGLSDQRHVGREMSAWAWGEFRSTSAWAMFEVLGALGGFDSRPWLGEIDVPTAVVVTGRDRAIPTARQRALAAAIPGASVHETPGGHASVVFDVHRWRPVFLSAVEDVVSEVARAE